IPKLGGDEQLVPRNRCFRDAATGAYFILVDGGGVDQTIAGRDGMTDDLSCLWIGHLPNSEAELRDNVSVVKCERGLFRHSSVSRICSSRFFGWPAPVFQSRRACRPIGVSACGKNPTSSFSSSSSSSSSSSN